jgi:hypothetical protein
MCGTLDQRRNKSEGTISLREMVKIPSGEFPEISTGVFHTFPSASAEKRLRGRENG